ncbi:MAG: TerB family tellurite resistance protein, partial [Flavobacterium sp.]|nr:TerB family tellurite resistance protein [Flavobacterium sp.]
KLAVQLEISSEEYAEILENPLKYPINPPYLHTQRLERLYDLSRMVYAEHVLGQRQKDILSKFALALGFTPGNAHYIVDKALSLMVLEVDLDTFLYEMQHMNK